MTNILGVHQTDFANNLAKTDGDIAERKTLLRQIGYKL